jgi:hypothetical protein
MKRLMNYIGETVKGRIAEAQLTPLENEIRKYILREFARTGSPPSSEEITEGLNLASGFTNQTIKKLQKADILLYRAGKIISAYPFSSLPTPNKVIFNDGRDAYALCATDALGIHFMLDEDITVISKCPICGIEMRIAVKNSQIDFSYPEGIIEFVSNVERFGCTAKTICPFINFFCSKEHLEEWRQRNPKYRIGEIYSLNDVLEHGRTIFGDLLK